MLFQQPARPFVQRHPWLTAGSLLCLAWLITHGAYGEAVIAATGIGLIAARRHRRSRDIRRAGLRARADLEHHLALAGDPRGTFGRFPPVQPGWFTDPVDRSRIRYFDGAAWTGHLAVPTRR